MELLLDAVQYYFESGHTARSREEEEVEEGQLRCHCWRLGVDDNDSEHCALFDKVCNLRCPRSTFLTRPTADLDLRARKHDTGQKKLASYLHD